MTPEETERRRKVVGASEAALLFGLPGFGGHTVSDLWYEKKFGTVGSHGNDSTKFGLKVEPLVLEFAEDRLGLPVVDRQRWFTLGANAATLDGRVVNEGPIVEAKTSGIFGPSKLAEWGEDGSDDVPDSYLIQCQAQMLVTGAELAYLAALIGGRGFAMFSIQRHDALQDQIRIKSTEFIASLASDVAPVEPPTLETLKRLRRVPSKTLPQSDEFDALVDRFEEARATAKESESVKNNLQRQVLANFGNAEAIEARNGLWTYFEQSRKESVMAASTFRVLRFKKEK